MKSVSELIANISEIIEPVRHNRKIINQIKDNLEQYNISNGDVQRYINFPSELKNCDIREICLFTVALHEATEKPIVDPLKYFNERQIKEAKTTYTAEISERASLPYTFDKVIKINEDLFIMKTTAKELKLLYDSGLIHYNHEYQREARMVKNDATGGIILEPKVNRKSVKEIESLLKRNELISSVLVFNARLGTADSGEELLYDEKSMELIITEGTLLDSLDGFHRLRGIISALESDPSLDCNFSIYIANYHTQKAKAFFRQLNTTNPISKSRLKEEEHDNLSSFIANQLQYNSELRGKVSKSARLEADMLVSFYTLAEGIQDVFSPKNKLEAIEISDYLTNFFNKLIYSYPKEFMVDIESSKKTTIINSNPMFIGFLLLARRMLEESIELGNLKMILSEVNFDRDNPLWRDIGILNSEGTLTGNPRKKVKDFYAELDISKVGV